MTSATSFRLVSSGIIARDNAKLGGSMVLLLVLLMVSLIHGLVFVSLLLSQHMRAQQDCKCNIALH